MTRLKLVATYLSFQYLSIEFSQPELNTDWSDVVPNFLNYLEGHKTKEKL